ncbi:MAG: VWA domain-containing protein [Planctomycetia bacterium]|nr:VWA domain-containing protein [Planctomycetia bacterium]
MVAELVAFAALVLSAAAEWLHSHRTRRIAPLAFGPTRRPAAWARLSPSLRVVAVALLAWGLTALLLLAPKVHKAGEIPESECRDLLLVLDVSPSMRLEDAGPDGKLSRRRRAAELLTSFFQRVPMELHRTTIVAFYTDAKPVVIRTSDAEVVHNILSDLPMQYAFKAGPTDVLAGLKEAARVAHPWRPKSTTLLLVSDGDSVPATGMPKLPASIAHVVVIGVGDPQKGKFIDGHLSRQDTSSLRQIATRLHGTYHNGNEKHLATDLVRQVTFVEAQSPLERLTRREYALLAIGFGAAVLGLLPLGLHSFGTRYSPGVRVRRESSIAPSEASPKTGAPRRDHNTGKKIVTSGPARG